MKRIVIECDSSIAADCEKFVRTLADISGKTVAVKVEPPNPEPEPLVTLRLNDETISVMPCKAYGLAIIEQRGDAMHEIGEAIGHARAKMFAQAPAALALLDMIARCGYPLADEAQAILDAAGVVRGGKQ